MTAKLYYWPTLPGRGEPVRLSFHLYGVPYVDIARDQGVQPMLDLLQRREGARPFAPPILMLDGEVHWQTAHCCDLIAGLGGVGQTVRTTALPWMMTIMDFAAEAHNTHHPISTSQYYEAQAEEAKVAAHAFCEHRIPKFLDFFEDRLASNGGLAHPESLTHADVALWHVHAGLEYAFPNAMARYGSRWPRVLALHARVNAHAGLSAYLESDARMAFNEDGLFRHYPELDTASL